MKGHQVLSIVVGALSICAEAIVLRERTNGAPRVVGLPVQRKTILDPVARDKLRRRAGEVKVSLDNEGTLYFANGTLGTPAQSFRLHIDTGSSDLWVNSAQSALCKSRGNPCTESGTYNANSSTTYSYLSSDFNITYADESGASGDYATDTITMGGSTLKSLQFGIGYQSTSSEGVLGVGYQANEVQVGRLKKPTYNNLPAQMVAENLIASNAYSLWLNDLDASTGQILFGGVDTEQFHGTLATLPIQPIDGVYAEFFITLTDISFGGAAIANNQRVPVLLDSGSSLTYLPNAITSAIYQAVGAEYDSSQGYAYVHCSIAQNTSTLDYTFSSPTISVALSELVFPIDDSRGQPLTFTDGSQACVFGITPAGEDTVVLGDTFLRSAYVVYDLANNEISIAQTNFNATKSNVIEIGTGSSAVPSATAVQNPAAASGVVSGGAVGGGTVTLSATTSATVAAAAPVRAAVSLLVMTSAAFVMLGLALC